MIDILEYIQRTQEARQEHLDLEQECLLRGGNSTNHRGVLAQYLNTPIYARPVDLCHGCHNGECSNPKHLYWGTRKENIQDAKDNGTWVSVWESMINKYGYEEACLMNKRNSNPAKGGAGNKGKLKTEEHKRKISETTTGRKRGPYKKK